jgi:hypothetical protein
MVDAAGTKVGEEAVIEERVPSASGATS